jgi:hypothetical protein
LGLKTSRCGQVLNLKTSRRGQVLKLKTRRSGQLLGPEKKAAADQCWGLKTCHRMLNAWPENNTQCTSVRIFKKNATWMETMMNDYSTTRSLFCIIWHYWLLNIDCWNLNERVKVLKSLCTPCLLSALHKKSPSNATAPPFFCTRTVDSLTCSVQYTYYCSLKK